MLLRLFLFWNFLQARPLQLLITFGLSPLRGCCGLRLPCRLSFWTVGVPLSYSDSAAPAARLVRLFQSALEVQPAREGDARQGLESVLADNVPLTSLWEVCSSWRWAAKQHINVFESGAGLSFYKEAALGGGRRCTVITDSAVVVGSHRKGRSSARLLRASLKRVSATQIAGGLYASLVEPRRRSDTRRATARSCGHFGVACKASPDWSSVSSAVSAVFPDLEPTGFVLPSSLSWLSTRLLVFLVKAPPHAWPLDFSFCGFAPGRFFPGTAMTFTALTVAYARFLLAVRCRSLDEVLAEKPFDTEGLVELLDREETFNKEPSSHHVAMPPIVLMAILSTCLAWGWTREAGIFALAWGALLRISEATLARRGNLIFPADALFMQTFVLVLVRIDQPKTRGRAAKHQSAKLEPSDLVAVAALAFLQLPKSSRLWPFSNQTLRRRLDCILDRLGIPKSGQQGRSLDLGSLRPGGATHLLQLTEDSELVRRRGRWASHKVMEIYLQEVSSSTFIMDLSETAREKVLHLAHLFPGILAQDAAASGGWHTDKLRRWKKGRMLQQAVAGTRTNFGGGRKEGHVMAYDFVGQALWLHGGEGMSDFWRYDLESSTWTQQVLAIEPASTNGGHAMVFDDQKHVLWLYGGKGSLSNGEKLWKFDIANMTWSEQTHALNKPVGRKNHAMVYDSHEQMLWVFGGRMSNGSASLVASLSCAAAIVIMVLAWKVRKTWINGRVAPETDGQYSLTDPMDFIRYLREADVRLVRLSYLLELQQKRLPWPRRQEAESILLESGETALVAESELRRLSHPTGRRFFTASGKLIHFGSVSHCWESMEHPDPWKFQLDQTMSRFRHMEGDRSQVWLFIDFMSLFQYPRSEAQNQSFLKALQGMHVLYAHELVKAGSLRGAKANSTLELVLTFNCSDQSLRSKELRPCQVEVLEELTPTDVQSAQKDCPVAVYNAANLRVEEVPAAALKLNEVPYAQRG
ncbi:Muskelin [Symbiodinium microadriaticum]|uniref:Muskelin n=1 Tax=Symbiodinium microadriaticum TaxID=2951 RepID=A0A1Q9EK26_SYMMI|nr:Muskelin [Symbiodinium microadriaticum]